MTYKSNRQVKPNKSGVDRFRWIVNGDSRRKERERARETRIFLSSSSSLLFLFFCPNYYIL